MSLFQERARREKTRDEATARTETGIEKAAPASGEGARDGAVPKSWAEARAAANTKIARTNVKALEVLEWAIVEVEEYGFEQNHVRKQSIVKITVWNFTTL